MEVSVRELKAHLSQYLRAVQAGEPVTITSREKPLARLEPVRATASSDITERLAAAVGISWAGGKPKGASIPLDGYGLSAAEVVIEDRR